MQQEELGMSICQVAWALLSTLNAFWLATHSGYVVYAVSSWAHATMPAVATILSMAILLWAGSYPTQLLFHTAWERIIA